MRKIATLQLLSTKRVQSFRKIREEEVSYFIEDIVGSSGRSINLSKMLYSLSNDITARAAFGDKCRDQKEFIEIAEIIVVQSGGFSIADLFPSVQWLEFICGVRKELDRLNRQGDRILDNIISEHRFKRSRCESEVEDLVTVLLDLMDQGDLEVPLTMESVKAVILVSTFLLIDSIYNMFSNYIYIYRFRHNISILFLFIFLKVCEVVTCYIISK